MRLVGRPGRYIFLPPKSSVYHIRFQYPPTPTCPKGRKVVFSLGVRDYREAERKSQDWIDIHLAALREHREDSDPSARRAPITIPRQKFNLGFTNLPDGRCVVVTREKPNEARIVDLDGGEVVIENIEDVPVPGLTLTEAEYWAAIKTDTLTVADPETGEPVDADCPEWRDKAKPKKEVRLPIRKRGDDPDLELLELWVKNQSVTPHIEREARLVFDTFKALTNGKRFDQSSFKDGVSLVDHLFKTNRWPTVRKKVGHMRAIVNFAEKRGLFEGRNPFANVMRKQRSGDIRKRGVFDDDDMALVRERGPEVFTKSEWLLWVLLATTGMRLSEAVRIQGEKVESGVRYIEVREGKTLQSQRRVPLPQGVLPLLPTKISGSLFPNESPPAVSKRMNRRLDTIGITDPLKVIHSLRHRAKDRLRAANIEVPKQYEILGHEIKTVASRYGDGSPVSLLKTMIDTIG